MSPVLPLKDRINNINRQVMNYYT